MSENPKKRAGRVLLVVAGCFILLIVVAYFGLTSGSFIKGVVIPRAEKSLNAQIKVDDVSLSPFSSVELSNFSLVPQGKDPLVSATKVRARYSLFAILKGNIKVEEVLLESPRITLVEYADGSSNLDPLLKKDPTTAKKPSEPGKPPVFDIKNVQLKNGTVQRIKKHAAGPDDVTELTGVNVSLNQLVTGQPSSLDITSNLKMVQSHTNELAGQISGKLTFQLTPDFKPQQAGGSISLSVNKATGSFVDASGLKADLTTDVTSKEIKAVRLVFSKGATALGEMRVSGPFNQETMEATLDLAVSGIDRNMLQLAGGKSGLDFGSTRLNSTNRIEISSGAKLINVNGGLLIDKFSVSKETLTTPETMVAFGYQVVVDQVQKFARIEKFQLQAGDRTAPFLLGKISQPMSISLGQGTGSMPDSSLQVTLTNFNLAAWRAFLGTNIQTGTINAELRLASLENGQKLRFDLFGSGRNLSAVFGSNQIHQAQFKATVQGEAEKFENLNLSMVNLSVGNERDLVTLATSGKINIKSQAMDIKVSSLVSLKQLPALISMPGVQFSNGEIVLEASVRQVANPSSTNNTMTVSGTAELRNLTGVLNSNRLDQFTCLTAFDISKDADKAQIKSLTAELSQAGRPGGKISATGEHQISSGTSRFNLTLDGVNENGVGSFLASMLGDKKLVSINLGGSMTAAYDPVRTSEIKGDFQLAKFVVQEPGKAQPNDPLSAGLKIQSSIQKQQIELKEFQLKLSPTAKAANQFNATGSFDLSKSNAMTGKLVVRSDGLDLTSFYDLSDSKKKKQGEKKSAQQDSKPVPTLDGRNANDEAEPMKLPVGNISADIQIAKIFLREIAISNLVLKGRVEGSKVNLTPISMSINGAPVHAKVNLDLGVPGYLYDLNFTADRIPLEPLANTFMPEDRGQYKGDLIAEAQIKGQGTTGKSLNKNLNGKVAFSFTNANIQLVSSGKTKLLLVPIATLLRIRDITESPLNWVHVVANLGQGEIDLAQLGVESEAFRATTQGKIPINDILTNSPIKKFPVKFELRRSLAEKSSLLPSDTPKEAKYVQLPTFVSLTGTLGEPKTDINEMAMAGLLLKSTTRSIGGDAGKVLQGLGNILSGQPRAVTNTNTNQLSGAKATNQSPQNSINQILDIFNKPKQP